MGFAANLSLVLCLFHQRTSNGWSRILSGMPPRPTFVMAISFLPVPQPRRPDLSLHILLVPMLLTRFMVEKWIVSCSTIYHLPSLSGSILLHVFIQLWGLGSYTHRHNKSQDNQLNEPDLYPCNNLRHRCSPWWKMMDPVQFCPLLPRNFPTLRSKLRSPWTRTCDYNPTQPSMNPAKPCLRAECVLLHEQILQDPIWRHEDSKPSDQNPSGIERQSLRSVDGQLVGKGSNRPSHPQSD